MMTVEDRLIDAITVRRAEVEMLRRQIHEAEVQVAAWRARLTAQEEVLSLLEEIQAAPSSARSQRNGATQAGNGAVSEDDHERHPMPPMRQVQSPKPLGRSQFIVSLLSASGEMRGIDIFDHAVAHDPAISKKDVYNLLGRLHRGGRIQRSAKGMYGPVPRQ